MRGPFTSYFVWRGEKPVLLVGGGSGVVPLMCMLRHRRRTMPDLPMRLVYSVRHADDVIYEDEIGDETLLTFTREPPEGWSGHTGHIDAELIAEAGIDDGIAFVCGSNGFVESGSRAADGCGVRPAADPHRALRSDRHRLTVPLGDEQRIARLTGAGTPRPQPRPRP